MDYLEHYKTQPIHRFAGQVLAMLPPTSLFFSRDPVAIECVMFDILNAEPIWHPKRGDHEDDYLVLAANAGLGTYERADPWLDTYTAIDYSRIVI